jgi:hypothetical protein
MRDYEIYGMFQLPLSMIVDDQCNQLKLISEDIADST